MTVQNDKIILTFLNDVIPRQLAAGSATPTDAQYDIIQE